MQKQQRDREREREREREERATANPIRKTIKKTKKGMRKT